MSHSINSITTTTTVQFLLVGWNNTWDGTTHTDIVYDDDYDFRIDDDAYGDSLNMSDPFVRLKFTQCLKTVQFQKYLQVAQHIDTIPKHT